MQIIENPTRVNKRFTSALREWRRATGKTAQDLASQIGCSYSAIYNWTSNRNGMSIKVFDTIRDVLRLPESYFLMENDIDAQHLLNNAYKAIKEELAEEARLTPKVQEPELYSVIIEREYIMDLVDFCLERDIQLRINKIT